MIHLLDNETRIQKFKEDVARVSDEIDTLKDDPASKNPWKRDIILIQLSGLISRQTILIQGLLKDIEILKEEIEYMQDHSK